MQACGLDGGSGITALAVVLEVDLSLTTARHDTGCAHVIGPAIRSFAFADTSPVK